MTDFMRGLGLVLAAGVVGLGTAGAQEDDQAEQTRGWLRILPVGDAPPFRQKIINGVRVQQPDAPGTTPPRKVLVSVPNQERVGITLVLGTASAPVVATAGPVTLLEERRGEDPAKWATLRMPESPVALAIMFRDPRAKLWDQSRSLLLADGVAIFPVGATRIVNASPFVATVVFAGKKYVLQPGKIVIRRRAGGNLENAVLRVAIGDGRGGVKRIYDSALSQGRGQRTNVVIYRADGLRPRTPAKILVQAERPFFPPLPKKPGAGT